MLDRYKLAAEIREILNERVYLTPDDRVEELVGLFVMRCREMYGDKPDRDKPLT